MSIDRIRYYAAVVETRNLRKASELVGISAPSMSKAISVLEGELGYKLIHPEGRGIGITPKGLEVYKHSLVLLEEYKNFHSRIKEGLKQSAQMRIGTFEVFSTYFISSFLEVENEYDIILSEMVPGKIEQAIIERTIDCGITYLPSPEPSLEYVEIGSFKLGIYGRINWIDVPFSDWPFAIPTTAIKIFSSEIDALDMWPREAAKRNIKYRFELLETALQTSRKNLSVLHCPDFIIKLQNLQVKNSFQLVSLPPPKKYKSIKPIKVYLVTRKGEIDSRLEKKLAKFMRSLGQ